MGMNIKHPGKGLKKAIVISLKKQTFKFSSHKPKLTHTNTLVCKLDRLQVR